MARWLYPKFAVQPPFIAGNCSQESGFQSDSFQGDSFQTDACPPVSKWLQPWNQPVRTVFREAVYTSGELFSPFVQVVAPQVFQPVVSGLDVLNRTYPRAALEASKVASPPPFFGPETTSVDKWLSKQPDLIARGRPQFEGTYVRPLFFLPEVTSVDRWSGEQLDSVQRIYPRATYTSIQLTPFVAPTEQIFVDKWHGYQPDYISKVKPQYDGLFIRPTFFLPEITSVDRWMGEQPDFIKRVYPWASYDQSVFQQYFVLSTENITPDKWRGSQPDFLLSKKIVYEGMYVRPTFFGPEVTSVDRWFRQFSEPQRRQIVQQQIENQPINTDSLSWNRSWVEPSKTIRRILGEQFTQVFVETLTVDKWWVSWSQPQRRKWTPEQIQFAPPLSIKNDWFIAWDLPKRLKLVLTESILFPPQVAVVVPSFGWWEPLVDGILTKKFRTELYGPQSVSSFVFLGTRFLLHEDVEATQSMSAALVENAVSYSANIQSSLSINESSVGSFSTTSGTITASLSVTE